MLRYFRLATIAVVIVVIGMAVHIPRSHHISSGDALALAITPPTSSKSGLKAPLIKLDGGVQSDLEGLLHIIAKALELGGMVWGSSLLFAAARLAIKPSRRSVRLFTLGSVLLLTGLATPICLQEMMLFARDSYFGSWHIGVHVITLLKALNGI